MEKWLDTDFASSSSETAQFKRFRMEAKRAIKKQAIKAGLELVSFNKGHFYFSGFLKKEDKFIYFSISDVRYFNNAWYNDVLIRTAKHDKDYTGGSNNQCKFDEIAEKALDLIK